MFRRSGPRGRLTCSFPGSTCMSGALSSTLNTRGVWRPCCRETSARARRASCFAVIETISLRPEEFCGPSSAYTCNGQPLGLNSHTRQRGNRDSNRWIPILANAMAVAAGYSCHGENCTPLNPFTTRMGALGSINPGPKLTVIDGCNNSNENP